MGISYIEARKTDSRVRDAVLPQHSNIGQPHYRPRLFVYKLDVVGQQSVDRKRFPGRHSDDEMHEQPRAELNTLGVAATDGWPWSRATVIVLEDEPSGSNRCARRQPYARFCPLDPSQDRARQNQVEFHHAPHHSYPLRRPLAVREVQSVPTMLVGLRPPAGGLR